MYSLRIVAPHDRPLINHYLPSDPSHRRFSRVHGRRQNLRLLKYRKKPRRLKEKKSPNLRLPPPSHRYSLRTCRIPSHREALTTLEWKRSHLCPQGILDDDHPALQFLNRVRSGNRTRNRQQQALYCKNDRHRYQCCKLLSRFIKSESLLCRRLDRIPVRLFKHLLSCRQARSLLSRGNEHNLKR